MPNDFYDDDIEVAAKNFANNHRHFNTFIWEGRPENSEWWGLYYTHHRDSPIMDVSNAKVLKKLAAKFPEDAQVQRHSHCLCGWIDGLVIRVYDDAGNITDVFKEFHALVERLENYPILDEEDLSNMESEALYDSVRSRIFKWIANDTNYDSITSEVLNWLDANDQRQTENVDGTGAYPSDESIQAALLALIDEDGVKLDRDWLEELLTAKEDMSERMMSCLTTETLQKAYSLLQELEGE